MDNGRTDGQREAQERRNKAQESGNNQDGQRQQGKSRLGAEAIRATARTGQPLEAENGRRRTAYNAGIADDTMQALYNR